MLAIVCGSSNVCGKDTGNTTVYRQAIDLYFNTLIGNKDMKSHLTSIVGGVDGDPDYISVEEEETTESETSEIYLELDYDEINLLELEQVVYDCEELRNTPQEELD